MSPLTKIMLWKNNIKLIMFYFNSEMKLLVTYTICMVSKKLGLKRFYSGKLPKCNPWFQPSNPHLPIYLALAVCV